MLLNGFRSHKHSNFFLFQDHNINFPKQAMSNMQFTLLFMKFGFGQISSPICSLFTFAVLPSHLNNTVLRRMAFCLLPCVPMTACRLLCLTWGKFLCC